MKAELALSADKQNGTKPGPIQPVDGPLPDLSADPVVRNYILRTAEEKRRFPPVSWPGMTGKKNLAICGLAGTTRHQAPFQDPAWDIWTMHMGAKLLERVDLLFEPHFPTKDEGGFEDFEPEYTQVLKDLRVPVMMQQKYPQFPTSIEYPKDEIVEQFGRFFSTSVGWMMALAIRNGYERIDLYGVEMEAGTEYISQAKCVVYFIGIAEGRGIKVGLPRSCQLMKNRYLYGWETKQADEVIQRIDRHAAELNQNRIQMANQLSHFQQEHERFVGALNEYEAIRVRILLAD